MREKIRRICETILLLFCSVQCGRAIYARYAEFLGKGKIVPSFILICGILLIVMALCGVENPLWPILLLAVFVIIPIIYSYFLHTKRGL